MNKLRTLPLTLSLLSACNIAIADNTPQQVGEILTQSADLVFKQNSKLNLKLIPVQDLKAGINDEYKIVATFDITSSPPVRIGVRWTPGVGEVRVPIVKIHGKNNPKNILELNFAWGNYDYDNKDEWHITRNLEERFGGSLVIQGKQQVAADTYTVSMDASAFIS